MKTRLLIYLLSFFSVINCLAQNSLVQPLPINSREMWQPNNLSTRKNNLANISTDKDGYESKTTFTNKNNSTLSNTIKKKYILKDANVAYSNGIIETTPNNYVLIGQTYDTVGAEMHWHLTLTGIDQNYTQVWKKSYGNNKFNYTHHTFVPMPLIKKGNFLYSAFFAYDSINKQPGIFIKFNFNGGTFFAK